MLTVHQSNQLEALIPALAEVCAPPLARPLTPEKIIVPNPGMARWLALQLADAQGICLNVDFSLPERMIWEIWQASLPDVPDQATFARPTLRWHLMQLLNEIGEDGPAPLRAYLEGGDDRQRHELAARIADVFDQYLVYRRDMVLGWEQGETDTTHPDEAWQAQLWRALVGRAGARHRARLLEEFVGHGGGIPRLPERLSVFGLPALPPAIFEVLSRMGASSEVHVFVVNPCEEYWFHTIPERQIARRSGDQDSEALHFEAGHPLLSSMGAQGRDFLSLLVEREVPEESLFVDPPRDTILGLLQRDIQKLRRPGFKDAPRHEVARDDESVLVRGSWSRMREVEALHDHLLDLFERNPDLDPSDVRVMMPVVDDYAPLIEAVFGAAPEHRRIPYAIADLRARTESAVIDAFLALLELPGSRYEAPAVLGLLETEAIRKRFGIDAQDLVRITQWVRDSGIRWGVDAEARAAMGLPGVSENTWRFGLDRLMFGYAMSGDGRELFAGVLPSDGVEGNEASLMGELQRFAHALISLAGALSGERPVGAWCDRMLEVIDEFFDPATGVVGGEEGSSRSVGSSREDLGVLRDAIEAVRSDAKLAAFQSPVSLDVVRGEVEAKLAAPGAAWAFLSGRVTFCTLLPMRSVPADVVCILGLNEGEFPRSHRPPSFDLIAAGFKPGDRARRDDDRYLFLEAILSARRALYLSHVSRSPRDNSEVPPSLLLAELEDAVREGFVVGGGEQSPSVRLEHRLQAFSPHYFRKGGPFFSYREDLCRALVARGLAAEAGPFVAEPLPEPDDEWRTVSVSRLARFFKFPARFFLRERLGLHLEEAEAGVPATERFSLGGLDGWRHRDEVLRRCLAGESPDEILPLLVAGGDLPHGEAGVRMAGETIALMSETAQKVAEAMPEGEPMTVPIDLMIGEFRIVGEIDRVFEDRRLLVALGKRGDRGARALDERDLVAAWIEQTVLAAAGRSLPTQMFVPGREGKLAVAENSGDILCDLLDFYWEGLRRPRPFFPRVAERFFSRSKDKSRAAKKAFVADDSSFGGGGEWDRHPELQLLWPNPDEALGGEFEAVSRRVWEPIQENLTRVRKTRAKKK